jgi:hypothetical protein
MFGLETKKKTWKFSKVFRDPWHSGKNWRYVEKSWFPLPRHLRTVELDDHPKLVKGLFSTYNDKLPE